MTPNAVAATTDKEVLNFLIKHPKTAVNASVAVHVIAQGRLDLLQIVISRGVPLSKEIILQRELQNNNLQLAAEMMNAAARTSHTEVSHFTLLIMLLIFIFCRLWIGYSSTSVRGILMLPKKMLHRRPNTLFALTILIYVLFSKEIRARSYLHHISDAIPLRLKIMRSWGD